jgi:hypothetical protein
MEKTVHIDHVTLRRRRPILQDQIKQNIQLKKGFLDNETNFICYILYA